MCPLTFIGLGLAGSKGLTLESLDTLSTADTIYLEAYTSPLHQDAAKDLEARIGKSVTSVTREFVEDGRTILTEAEKEKVALLSPGDPMVATTHSELRTRALQKGIIVKTIHNASVLTALPGETGLHSYKFGKTITLTKTLPAAMRTAYSTVFDNLTKGLHTTLLLEYDYASRTFLAPNEALATLAEIEKDEGGDIFTPEAFIIVASRLGSETQMVTGGSLRNLMAKSYGEPPHVLLVPGSLHFTEEEALRAIGLSNSVADNSSKVRRRAVRMVPRYVEKTRKALDAVRKRYPENELVKLGTLFENIECYLSDAQRFLAEGKDELAVLSVGYAEGLLDALRLKGEVEVEW